MFSKSTRSKCVSSVEPSLMNENLQTEMIETYLNIFKTYFSNILNGSHWTKVLSKNIKTLSNRTEFNQIQIYRNKYKQMSVLIRKIISNCERNVWILKSVMTCQLQRQKAAEKVWRLRLTWEIPADDKQQPFKSSQVRGRSKFMEIRRFLQL